MDRFFAGPALGDKWVPWSTACGDHEVFIAQRIYRDLTHLDDEEKYLAHMLFRGSSCVPLFEHIFLRHCLRAPGANVSGSEAESKWKALLHTPKFVFTRGGWLHNLFVSYRDLGGLNRKLHTSCYRSRPPKGAAGEDFTWYIVERTLLFVSMGKAVYDAIENLREARQLPTRTQAPTQPLSATLSAAAAAAAASATLSSPSPLTTTSSSTPPLSPAPSSSLSPTSSFQSTSQPTTAPSEGSQDDDGNSNCSSNGSSSTQVLTPPSSSFSSLSALAPSPMPFKRSAPFPPSSCTSGCEALCGVMCGYKDIGPTMSKMLMVTTHLLYPELKLLDDFCQVGDGAEPALGQLFDLPEHKLKTGHREQLLVALHAHLEEHVQRLEPRLLPLLRWTVGKTREQMRPLGVKDGALPLTLSLFELQVNLCEWRKMINAVDTGKVMRRGCSAEDVRRCNQRPANKAPVPFAANPALPPSLLHTAATAQAASATEAAAATEDSTAAAAAVAAAAAGRGLTGARGRGRGKGKGKGGVVSSLLTYEQVGPPPSPVVLACSSAMSAPPPALRVLSPAHAASVPSSFPHPATPEATAAAAAAAAAYGGSMRPVAAAASMSTPPQYESHRDPHHPNHIRWHSAGHGSAATPPNATASPSQLPSPMALLLHNQHPHPQHYQQQLQREFLSFQQMQHQQQIQQQQQQRQREFSSFQQMHQQHQQHIQQQQQQQHISPRGRGRGRGSGTVPQSLLVNRMTGIGNNNGISLIGGRGGGGNSSSSNGMVLGELPVDGMDGNHSVGFATSPAQYMLPFASQPPQPHYLQGTVLTAAPGTSTSTDL